MRININGMTSTADSEMLCLSGLDIPPLQPALTLHQAPLWPGTLTSWTGYVFFSWEMSAAFV